MSDTSGIIEHMFDNKLHGVWNPPLTPASRALVGELLKAGRAENQAAARRLTAIAELFELRRRQRDEEPDWAVDTWAAVGAEVAAALRVGLGKAGGYLTYALAMRRLPAVAAAFRAGDIDMNTYRVLVYRTELITAESARIEVDRLLAARAARWPSMTQGQLIREVDRVVAERDPDAVRRVKDRVRDRDVTVWTNSDGTTDISGRLFTADAALFDQRLNALAATVCADDPRTVSQRRADAVGALSSGADRLMCRCANPGCPATAATPSAVVIHVVADQATLDGRAETPGYLLGADALISADLLRELAAHSRQRPLLPADTPPEPGYQPSTALSDFVRARDLTCRAPGCDRPATDCDIDHTIPRSVGGATHASNLKCLCRTHHLTKTFWGWRDRQLQDGSVIWTLPDGQTYLTTPGSALLFPALMAPTGPLPPLAEQEHEPSGTRTEMMPRRKTTRAQNRAHRIASERNHNRQLRHKRDAVIAARLGITPTSGTDEDEPPF